MVTNICRCWRPGLHIWWNTPGQSYKSKGPGKPGQDVRGYKTKYIYLFSCECSDMLEALCSVNTKESREAVQIDLETPKIQTKKSTGCGTFPWQRLSQTAEEKFSFFSSIWLGDKLVKLHPSLQTVYFILRPLYVSHNPRSVGNRSHLHAGGAHSLSEQVSPLLKASHDKTTSIPQ